MEHTPPQPSDRDNLIMSSFERDKDETDEEKKKKKAKSRKEKAASQAKNTSDSDRKSSDKKDGEHPERRKPSILDMLVDGDATEEKSEKPKKSTADKSDTKEADRLTDETLTDEEKLQATDAFIAARSEQLQSEVSQQSDEDTELETAPRLANMRFLEQLQQRIASSKELPTDEQYQDLVDFVVADVMNESKEHDQGEAITEDMRIEADAADSNEEDDRAQTPAVASPPISNPSPPSRSFVWTSGGASGGGSGSSGGGQGSVPPFFGGGPPPSHINIGPNVAPGTNPLSSPERPSASRHNRGPDLLLGGFVGYLIGRRRGRIKTEQELASVERSLTKQIKQLELTVTSYEKKTRKQVAEIITTAKDEAECGSVASVLREAGKSFRESNPKRADVPESYLAHSSEQQTTTGNVTPSIIKSPETKSRSFETQPGRPDVMSRVRENIGSATKADVLEVADIIMYRGQTLRTLHEQADVSEPVMRQIVAEHLRGGRIEVLVARSLAESARTKEQSPEVLASSRSLQVTSTQDSYTAIEMNHRAPDRMLADPQHVTHTTDSACQPKTQLFKTPGLNQPVTIGALIGLTLVIIVIFALL
ncbi:hypothetical protein BH23PAT2_BH23PAT2_05220 [soil metagenome]